MVVVVRFRKMVYLTVVSTNIMTPQTAPIFVDIAFRLHGMPEEIILDRDSRFTARF